MYTSTATQKLGRRIGATVTLAFDEVPNRQQLTEFATGTFSMIQAASDVGYSKEQRAAGIANVAKGILDELTDTVFKLPEA